MKSEILIVPGYHGSSKDHWQSWLELQLPNSKRVKGIDWEKPIITNWSKSIIAALDNSAGSVVIVAHSFGCLASAIAVTSRRHKVAGCIFVAPADPARFSLFGLRQGEGDRSPSIAQLLPETPITDLGLLIGSQNDPWMKLSHAYAWSERWGMSFYNAGPLGHINVESGHGAWPLINVVTQTFCNLADHRYARKLDQDIHAQYVQ